MVIKIRAVGIFAFKILKEYPLGIHLHDLVGIKQKKMCSMAQNRRKYADLEGKGKNTCKHH